MVPIVGQKNAYSIVSRYALDALLAGPSPKLQFQQAHQVLKNKPQAIGWLVESEYISTLKRKGITILKRPFPYGLTEDDVRAVKQGALLEPEASNQPAFDLIQLTNESVGCGKDVVTITMTQVSKQIKGKEFNAELILKEVVKFAAKFDLDASLLGIRIIPQIPESVLPDTSAFEPTVTPLKTRVKEDYNQTIRALAPKKLTIKADFERVAEKFQLQHDNNAMTLATLYVVQRNRDLRPPQEERRNLRNSLPR